MAKSEQAKLDRLKMPDIGDLLDERYRIQSVLATGGMGVILRAEQLPMQRPVAIKLLHPHVALSNSKVVDRFEQEVRLAKLLNHPNTIRLYDFGESTEGLIYVAMEYLEGVDLKRLLADNGALPAGRALEITRQMLDGLAEAHSHDFIHRDLKPSNVFITKSRRGEDFVKLLDFGIAKSLDGSDVDLTASGSICGTPGYVAPEYLRNEPLEKASDIYAVGLMLLEMLTGQRVFRGDAPVQTMMMHLQIEPDIPPAIEATPLAPIIRKATEKQPSKRYADADVMLKALEAIIEEIPADLHILDYEPGEQRISEAAVTPPPQVSEKLQTESQSSSLEEDSSASIPEADQTPLSMKHSPSSGLHRVGPPPMPGPVEPAEAVSEDEAVSEEVELDEIEVEELDEIEFDEAGFDETGADQLDSIKGGFAGLNQQQIWMLGGGVAALVVLALVLIIAADPGSPVGDEASANAAVADATEQQDSDAGSASSAAAGAAGSQKAGADASVEEAKRLRFDLDSDPSGATAFVDDREIGTTPLTYEAVPDELPQTVTFKLDGYTEQARELAHDGLPVVVVVLDKLPEETGSAHAESGGAASERQSAGGHRANGGRREPEEQEKNQGGEAKAELSDDKVEKVLDEFLVE